MKSATSVLALAAAVAPIVLATPFHMERHAEPAVVIDYVTDVDVVTQWAEATVWATEGAPAPAATVVVTTSVDAPATTSSPAAKQNEQWGGQHQGQWSWSWGGQWTQKPTSTPQAAPTTSSTPPPPPPPPSTTSSTEAAPTTTSTTPVWVAPTTTAWSAPSVPATTAAPINQGAYTTAVQAPSSSVAAWTGNASYDAADGTAQAASIQEHNMWRAKFQAQPLVWNTTLEQMALDVLNNVTAQCLFEHSNAGQNIGAGYDGPKSAIDSWAGEYTQFNFADPDYSDATGHFTQVVWQDTTSVGCAAHYCNPDGPSAQNWFYICNYFPVGNMLGEFPQNVKSEVS